MAAPVDQRAAGTPVEARRPRPRLRWWREVLIILGLSVIYNTVRSGSQGSTALALEHAQEVLRWQRMVGLNFEESLQDWALHFTPLVIALNYVYGSLHFLVTGAVIIFLFRRHPGPYRLWRNALMVATFLGLAGFVTWPLMPPRLLPDSYGFVDTLARYPTLWSFDSGALNKISNQYAAMPSLHFAWALYCTCSLLSVVRHPLVRLAATAYLPLTLAAIVLTGNHFFLDAAAGAAVFGVGYLVARRFTPDEGTPGPRPVTALT